MCGIVFLGERCCVLSDRSVWLGGEAGEVMVRSDKGERLCVVF